jgi:hypothetical protein
MILVVTAVRLCSFGVVALGNLPTTSDLWHQQQVRDTLLRKVRSERHLHALLRPPSARGRLLALVA